jgi:hypothetical protein
MLLPKLQQLAHRITITTITITIIITISSSSHGPRSPRHHAQPLPLHRMQQLAVAGNNESASVLEHRWFILLSAQRVRRSRWHELAVFASIVLSSTF